MPGRPDLVRLGDGHEGGLRHARETSRGGRANPFHARPATPSSQQPHDVQRDRGRAIGVVEDLLVGRAQVGPCRQRLTGTGVAVEERVGAARDLEADAVAGPERVGGGPHGDVERADTVLVLLDRAGRQPDDAVAQVERLALLRHVTQAHEEVGVLERRAHVERGRQRADDGEVLGQHGAGVGEHVAPALAPACSLRPAVAMLSDGPPTAGVGSLRVVVVPVRRVSSARRGLRQRAPPPEIPPLGPPRRRPHGELLPRARAHDEDAHRRVRRSASGRRARAGCRTTGDRRARSRRTGRGWRASRGRWSGGPCARRGGVPRSRPPGPAGRGRTSPR